MTPGGSPSNKDESNFAPWKQQVALAHLAAVSVELGEDQHKT